MSEECIDIHDPLDDLIRRLGYDPAYVFLLQVSPDSAQVSAYRGKEGFCKGPKFVVDGEPAIEEPKTFKVKT